MEQYFTFGAILLILLGSTWQYVRLKKLSRRVIIADYALKQSHVSLKWTGFILPGLLLFAGLYEVVNMFLVLAAVVLLVSTLSEWLLTSKYKYDSFTIRDYILTKNEFKCKDFNLEELSSIDFLPFSDCFKLKFLGGQSLSIHRPSFSKESLTTFLNLAICKSRLSIAISEDAKSKIYVSDIASV